MGGHHQNWACKAIDLIDIKSRMALCIKVENAISGWK
jgi:hypothetical protein